MREGRTLTRTLEIEPRQHDLFGLDLGEGPLRGQLIFGLCAVTLWLALTVPLSFLWGGPGPNSALLFVAPPLLVTAIGWRHSEDNPRRRLVTVWVLTGRWVLFGHRPVVTVGRQVRRTDSARFRDRFAARFGGGDLMALAVPGRLHDGKQRDRATRNRGRHEITFSPIVRTLGTGYTEAVVQAEPRHRRPPTETKESAA